MHHCLVVRLTWIDDDRISDMSRVFPVRAPKLQIQVKPKSAMVEPQTPQAFAGSALVTVGGTGQPNAGQTRQVFPGAW